MSTTFSAVTTIWNWPDSSLPMRLSPTSSARMTMPAAQVGTTFGIPSGV